MRRLHSESHLAHGGDDAFLAKLEQRPYEGDNEGKQSQAFQASGKGAKPTIQIEVNDVTQEDMTNIVRSVMNEEPIPNTCHNLRSLSALGNILQVSDMSSALPDLVKQNRTKSASDTVGFYARPHNPDLDLTGQMDASSDASPDNTNALERKQMATVLDVERQNSKITMENRRNVSPRMTGNELQPPPKRMPPNLIENRTCSIEDTTDLISSRSSLSSNSRSTMMFENPNIRQIEPRNNIRRAVLPRSFVKPMAQSPSPSVETNNTTPLPGKEIYGQSCKGCRKKKTSIFEEGKKPDFRKERLAMAKAVDHSDLIRNFCDGLAAFGPGVPNFDYYASKMQEDARTQIKPALINTAAPGTPEATYRKYTGDQTIKCITLPRLKLRRCDEMEDSDNPAYDQQALFDSLVLSRADGSVDTDSESIVSFQS